MIELSEAQAATIITGVHTSLALPLTRSADTGQMRLQAYAEIISDPMNAVDTLALGEAIDAATMLESENDMVIEPSALIEMHGNRMASRALMYAGVSPERSGARTEWRVGNPGPGGRVLTLPATMLQDWLSEF